MTKFKTVTALERVTLEPILKAASPPRAPTFVHPSIVHLVPKAWDGIGDAPVGWSRDFGFAQISDGTQFVIVSDALAAAVPALVGASDTAPVDAVADVGLPARARGETTLHGRSA